MPQASCPAKNLRGQSKLKKQASVNTLLGIWKGKNWKILYTRIRGKGGWRRCTSKMYTILEIRKEKDVQVNANLAVNREK